MIEIIPTNTCPSDLAELSRRSELLAHFAAHVQLDVDDGVFAPALSWPYQEGQWDEVERMATQAEMLPHADRLVYEVHLMVEDPVHIGELLARVGCSRVIGHIEAFENVEAVRSAFSIWKAAGAIEVGLAILLDTQLSSVDPLIAECDVVQIMSIGKLGYQGASFESQAIERVAMLHARHPDLVIEVDGGISQAVIAELARAGATRFAVGSAITEATDPKAAYEQLGSVAETAIQ